MHKIKIPIIGPTKSGKTTIANFLSDSGDNIGSEYVPTIGCRILEMEQDMRISNRIEKVEVELWDCSGDLKYQNCWPAMSFEANGVIFVYNPNDPSHAKELNQWFTYFVQNSGIREEVCLVISNKFATDDGSKGDGKLANLFGDIKLIQANMDEGSENFRAEFKNHLQKVAAYSKSKQDQEEKMILK